MGKRKKSKLAAEHAVAISAASSGTKNPEPWLVDALGGAESATGIRVNDSSAMAHSMVFACVNARSQDVAKLPLRIMRRDTLEEATDHPLFRVFSRHPNRYQNRVNFLQMMQAFLDLRGNAYAYIAFDEAGQVDALIPMFPDRTTTHLSPDGELYYGYSPATKIEAKYLGKEGSLIHSSRVLHLQGLSLSMLAGESRVARGRETIGLAMAMEKHGAKMFANAARLSGVFSHPGQVKDRPKLRAELERLYTGIDNAFRIAVLEEGMTWHQIGMNAEDAQLIESRKFQAEDISRLFRMPPHKVGIMDHATFSNIEHQSLEYVTDSLQPSLELWEAELERKLLSDEEARDYYIEFDVDRLLRGDFKTRMEGYAIARNWGFLSVNEIRREMNRRPITGGDEYLRPLNMQPVGKESPFAPNKASEGLVIDGEFHRVFDTTPAGVLVPRKTYRGIR